MKHSDSIIARFTTPQYIYLFFVVTLVLPNLFLAITEPMTLLEKVVNVLLPLGLYTLFMSMSRNLGRSILIFFPIVFLAAFQIVLLGLYGRSIIAVDMFLNLSTTNPGEAGELLASIWPSVLFVLLLYVPSLVLGVVMMVRKVRLPEYFILGIRLMGGWLSVLGTACLIVAVCTDHSYAARNDLYPMNVVYNIALAARHNEKVAHHDMLASEFRFDAHATHSDSVSEIYVMVVGETSRADHWEINGYGRETTPHLAARNDIYSFTKCISESNTTHKSVPLLLSHLGAETYNDSIYNVKSIITAFNEAGFHTAFISNQRHNGSFIDMFGAEADTTIFLKETDGLDMPDATDLDLLPVLGSILAQGGRKQLVVIHSYGSHFNYRDRYPRELAFFTPDDYEEAKVSERARLVNAYDNTIRVTDLLLDGIISRLDASGADCTAMIYTSDHGEDIYDDNRELFLHASPCPSYYQLHVPFVVWLSEGYATAWPEMATGLHSNLYKSISSSESFFDTTLTLAGIITPRTKVANTLTALDYNEHLRLYLNDHNRAVALSASGFTDLDSQLITRLDNGTGRLYATSE